MRERREKAAVSVRLGLSILSDVAVLADHRVLGPKDGFAKLSNTEMALIIHPDASAATRRLADLLRDFCTAFEARTAA